MTTNYIDVETSKFWLETILNQSKQHYNDEWHLTIDNNTWYYFELFCKKLDIKKNKGPATTPKTTKEEKLKKRMVKKRGI